MLAFLSTPYPSFPIIAVDRQMGELDNTYGAVVIGAFLSAILFGVTNLQVFIYFQQFYTDGFWIKLAVCWLLDATHVALCVHMVYWYLVANFFDPVALFEIVWSFKAQIMVDAIVVISVHTLYTLRLWKRVRSSLPTTSFVLRPLGECDENGQERKSTPFLDLFPFTASRSTGKSDLRPSFAAVSQPGVEREPSGRLFRTQTKSIGLSAVVMDDRAEQDMHTAKSVPSPVLFGSPALEPLFARAAGRRKSAPTQVPSPRPDTSTLASSVTAIADGVDLGTMDRDLYASFTVPRTRARPSRPTVRETFGFPCVTGIGADVGDYGMHEVRPVTARKDSGLFGMAESETKQNGCEARYGRDCEVVHISGPYPSESMRAPSKCDSDVMPCVY
ncbi:uncharacterized protein FIBRA_07497 [Fibroporia radiculosa]|uniref:Uncharacterized protein n=1 Tax=Fibroporia radiculosa TaxID=599839 RepID=J4GV33_9APHY|nr:uncharacterized protein FIBRA_07497 [Fibroporia radiculosa]CCM05285.1 predicted protein [Fibroporia radiculosa]